MEPANLLNLDFVNKLYEVKKERDYMTLFIDNIRLYKRVIEDVKPEDRDYVNSLMATSDLLELCSHFSSMKFIIFTNLEDTPIDGFIHGLIPENVLCISAINAIAHGDKVIPAPYGLQRRMTPDDKRIEQLQSAMNANVDPSMFKLLYVNHNDNSLPDRLGIKDIFKEYESANVDEQRVDYYNFL